MTGWLMAQVGWLAEQLTVTVRVMLHVVVLGYWIASDCGVLLVPSWTEKDATPPVTTVVFNSVLPSYSETCVLSGAPLVISTVYWNPSAQV
jgi:hypothetical protein